MTQQTNPGPSKGRSGGPFKMKLVEVITDSEAAKLLSDPMRRGILNLLRQRAMSQAELAESLGLTDATVNYHLRILRKIGYLTVAHKEVEEHGIMQKFYAPTAFLYLPDVATLPKEAARYYYPVNIERMRGVLSAGKALRGQAAFSKREVDSLGEDLARELVKVAVDFAGVQVNQGEGEDQVNEMYSRALTRLFTLK